LHETHLQYKIMRPVYWSLERLHNIVTTTYSKT